MRKREVVYGITEAPNTDALSKGERIPWIGFVARSRFGGTKKFLWWRNFLLKSGCQTTCEQLFWRFGIEAEIGPAIDLGATRKIKELCLIEDRGVYGIYIEEECRPMFNFLFGMQALPNKANPKKLIFREWKGCGGAFAGFSPNCPYPYHQSCKVEVRCTKCREVRAFTCRCSGKKIRNPDIFNWKTERRGFPTDISDYFTIVGDTRSLCQHKRFKVREIKPTSTTRYIKEASEGQASVFVECAKCKEARQIRPLSGPRFIRDKEYSEEIATVIWSYELAYKNQEVLTDQFICSKCGEAIELSSESLKLFKPKERGWGTFLECEWTCPHCNAVNEFVDLHRYGLEEDEELTWHHLGVFCCPECGSFEFRMIDPVFWITAEAVEAALGD